MEVRVYKSITEIDEAEWDAIVGRNRLICRHKYIEAVEKSRINDCRFFYLVVYDNGVIVAHATCYYITTELDSFAQGTLKKTISLVRRIWKGFFILKTLECGTPVAAGNTLSFKEGVDRIKALELICREMERIAKELKVKVTLLRDFYDEELESFDYFTTLGYTKIHNLPSTRIEVKWKTFDEYLQAVRRRYRREIIKHRKRFYGRDISVEMLGSFANYANDLERLWANVFNRAREYKREQLTADFFKNIDTYLGDRSSVLLIKKANIPIAFSLFLLDDDILIPLFCGLDYKYNHDYDLYLNLLYKNVEIGIAHRKKDIDMGITTLVPKKEIGAEITSMNMYIKHFNPIMNKIIPGLFEIMTPKDNSGPRNVFKVGEECDETNGKVAVKTDRRPERIPVEV